jgi:hypothetical protein
VDRRTGELLDYGQMKQRVKEGAIDPADLVQVDVAGGTVSITGPPAPAKPEREPGKKYRWLHNPSATKKKKIPKRKLKKGKRR